MYRWLAVIGCVILSLGRAHGAPEASFGFSEKGLSSVRYGETEFLASGEVGIGSVLVRDAKGKAVTPDPGKPTVHFDPESRHLVQDLAWGRIDTAYEVLPNRLNIRLTVSNGSPDPIVELALGLMELRFPKTPAGDAWAKGFEIGGDNQGDITAGVADFGTGCVVLCNDDVTSRVLLAYVPFNKTRLVRMSTIPWTDVNQALVPAGESRTYSFSLRFATPGAPLATICADLYKQFLDTHPFQLKWSDRRPIGMLALASGYHSSASNPRGWFNDPALDVRGPRGLAQFRGRLMQTADQTIGILRGMNAQGAIVWDMEGEQFANINYVGDPRMTAKLAPEMDAAAEEFFAKLRAAGLRVGVCIRPSRIVPGWDGTHQWAHSHMGLDVVEEMNRKIAYAKKRFGCTLFYIDSNARYFQRPDGRVDSRLLEGDAFLKLARAHPDVLLIPEQASLDYWACTAPYRELRPHAGGYSSTPAEVLRVYPRAFSVINPVDAPAKEHRAELAAAFRRGDILLFRAWFNDDQNALFRAILQEAQGQKPERPAALDRQSGKR